VNRESAHELRDCLGQDRALDIAVVTRLAVFTCLYRLYCTAQHHQTLVTGVWWVPRGGSAQKRGFSSTCGSCSIGSEEPSSLPQCCCRSINITPSATRPSAGRNGPIRQGIETLTSERQCGASRRAGEIDLMGRSAEDQGGVKA